MLHGFEMLNWGSVESKIKMSKFQFDVALRLLNVVGLSPLEDGKLAIARRFVPILCYTITGISGLSEFFIHYRGMESCTRVSQWLLPQIEVNYFPYEL